MGDREIFAWNFGMPQIPFFACHFRPIPLLLGKLITELSAFAARKVSGASESRRLALSGSFPRSKSPSARRAARGWNMSYLRTDTRKTRVRCDYPCSLAARQMESNRRERLYITISADLRHGAGRAEHFAWIAAAAVKLIRVESPRCFFALRSHLRHSRSREKEERTEQFRNIDIHEREKWSGREGERRVRHGCQGRGRKHAGRFC